MNKVVTFLKKLWCCVDGEYYKIIWFYQLARGHGKDVKIFAVANQ